MPAEDPDAYHETLPPPLDPVTYVEVNRIVMGARRDAFSVDGFDDRRFAIDFWRSRDSALALAKYSVSPRTIRRMREDVLNRFKARFLRSKHPDLLALIKFIPETDPCEI